VFRGSYAVVGPVHHIIPVDVTIAGCPPEPADILRGILHALDRLGERRAARPAAERGAR
jgi:Ni,Fe-hydrogenase III small subunit